MGTNDLAVLRCHHRSNRSHHCIRAPLQTPVPDRSARASVPAESRVQPSFPSQRRRPPLPALAPAPPRRAKVRIAAAAGRPRCLAGFVVPAAPGLRLPTASGDGQGTTAPTGLPGPPRRPALSAAARGRGAPPLPEVPGEPGRGQARRRCQPCPVPAAERGRGRRGPAGQRVVRVPPCPPPARGGERCLCLALPSARRCGKRRAGPAGSRLCPGRSSRLRSGPSLAPALETLREV